MVGVKTTGIFCRPTCSARKPLQKNVEFFPMAKVALSAGYRPCKRCKPMGPPRAATALNGHDALAGNGSASRAIEADEPAWLTRLHAALADESNTLAHTDGERTSRSTARVNNRSARTSPSTGGKPSEHTRSSSLTSRIPRLRDADLVRLGVTPSTARRYFLTHHGMTFHAYCRARRLGHTLGPIRAASQTPEPTMKLARDPSLSSSPASCVAIGSAASFAVPSVTSSTGPAPLPEGALRARWLDTPLGGMLAIVSHAGLHLLEFVDRRALETELAAVRARANGPIEPGEHEHLDHTAAQLAAYFAGTRTRFDLPLDIRGSDFQRRVWDRLLQIPFGETRSYSGLATQLGAPGASRAVGLANGKNQIAIIIPCHRVIRSDGTLCGYAGGIHRKRWLLDHEARFAPRSSPAASLFAGR